MESIRTMKKYRDRVIITRVTENAVKPLVK